MHRREKKAAFAQAPSVPLAHHNPHMQNSSQITAITCLLIMHVNVRCSQKANQCNFIFISHAGNDGSRSFFSFLQSDTIVSIETIIDCDNSASQDPRAMCSGPCCTPRHASRNDEPSLSASETDNKNASYQRCAIGKGQDSVVNLLSTARSGSREVPI